MAPATLIVPHGCVRWSLRAAAMIPTYNDRRIRDDQITLSISLPVVIFELAPVFILTVMSVESPGVLDTCFAQLPLHQTLGDQIHTRFTPLRSYEGFASDVSERAGSNTKCEEGKGVLKQGLFYLLTCTVEYDSGMI